ncbi:hypothetical protein GCM10027088_33400 [Nocardia goodfellowii]
MHELPDRWWWMGHADATGSGCPVSERAVFPDHEWFYESPPRWTCPAPGTSTADQINTSPAASDPREGASDQLRNVSIVVRVHRLSGTTASRPGRVPADSSSAAGGQWGTTPVAPTLIG